MGIKCLLYNSFFEVFCEVGADLGGSAFGGDFGDVVLYHELDEVFEGGFVRIPTQLGFGLGGVAPKVDHVGGTVEVRGDADYDVAN